MSLTPSSFYTGPDTTAVTQDIYKLRSTGIINSIQDITKNNSPTLNKALTGFNQMDVSNIAKAALGIGIQDPKKMMLLNRVLATSPTLAATLKGMDNSIKNLISKGMDAVTGPFNKDKIKVTNPDGSTTYVKADDVFNCRALADSVKSVTGKATMAIKDTAADVGFMTSISKLGSQLGDDKITKEVLGVITDNQVLNQTAYILAPEFASKASTRDMFNLVDATKTGTLKSMFPLMIRTVADFYKENNTNTNYSNFYNNSSSRAKSYAELLAVLRGIDPNWDTYVRMTDIGAQNVIDVHQIVGGSEAFRSVWIEGVKADIDEMHKAYIAAAYLTNVDVTALLKNQYPKAAFNFDTSVKKIQDPRSLFNF